MELSMKTLKHIEYIQLTNRTCLDDNNIKLKKFENVILYDSMKIWSKNWKTDGIS